MLERNIWTQSGMEMETLYNMRPLYLVEQWKDDAEFRLKCTQKANIHKSQIKRKDQQQTKAKAT